MRTIVALLIAGHGAIHLLGVARGFGLARLSQLTGTVTPLMAVVWLSAAGLLLATSVLVFMSASAWWIVAAAGVVVSLLAIAHSWQDAWAGAIVNLAIIPVVVYGAAAHGPWSLESAYRIEVGERMGTATVQDIVGEADLEPLPEPVRRYLRVAGVVGQPPVRNVRVLMHGRIRSNRTAPWLALRAEQYNFFGEPARFFYLDSSMYGIPIHGLHRYVADSASMRILAAGILPVARESGVEMLRSETVTLFNDMCLLAPATLIDRAIAWEPVDDRHVRAAFTNAGVTIRAELTFNDRGELENFRSDDRRRTADGTLIAAPWSTPTGPYRVFGQTRLTSGGEARWHETDGEYSYIELTFESIDYNVPAYRPR